MMASGCFRIRQPLWLLVASVAFFFLCDALIFRTGLYLRYMKGNDVGTLYYRVEAARAWERGSSSNKTVLLLGNSQVERGFAQTDFEDQHKNAGVTIVRLDAPKTYEQIWYYALKYSDPNHDKFDNILITLPNYKVEPFGGFGQAPAYSTATFLAPFIGPHDWLGLLKSYDSIGLRLKALKLALLAGHAYAFDIQDFLLHPVQRIAEYKRREEIGDQNVDPPFVPGSWSDLTIRDGKVTCPPSYPYFDCIGGAQNAIEPLPLDAARAATIYNETYERKWLGKIFALYSGSRTRIYVMQMPRWPEPLPERTPIADAPDLRAVFGHLPNVTFIDDRTFAPLETPEYMHDHVHVSTNAKDRFTQIMGDEILKIAHQN